MADTASCELIENAHPRDIRTGDLIKISLRDEVRVAHVWRTGTEFWDKTWVDVGFFYPLTIDHGSRLHIKRPTPPAT